MPEPANRTPQAVEFNNVVRASVCGRSLRQSPTSIAALLAGQRNGCLRAVWSLLDSQPSQIIKYPFGDKPIGIRLLRKRAESSVEFDNRRVSFRVDEFERENPLRLVFDDGRADFAEPILC